MTRPGIFCALAALAALALPLPARAGQYLQFQGTFGNASVSGGPIASGTDSAGNLYVLQSSVSTSNVVEFDSAHNYVGAFGSTAFAFALAAAPDGSAYVAAGASLTKYDSSHAVVGTVGSGFSSANGLATDASSDIYVADSGNNRIVKLDAVTGGTALTIAPSGGNAFNHPFGVAVDASGNIYVADSFDNRIEIFDAAGNYLSQFSTVLAAHPLAHPISIAVPASGIIYITDDFGVDAFTASGTFLETYDTGFDIPRRLSSFGSTLYVVDRNSGGAGPTHNQVDVFTIPVPEPASTVLLAVGSVSLLVRRPRGKKSCLEGHGRIEMRD